MTSLWPEATDASSANPLDLAEQVLLDRDWAFDRPETRELLADYTGSWCNYRLSLSWHECFGALTLSCVMDTKVAPKMAAKLYPLLAKVNEKMWLGHFEVPEVENGSVTFRYAMMARNGVTPEILEDLLDIAITECERFYPAFQSILWGDKSADDVLKIALMETVGEA